MATGEGAVCGRNVCTVCMESFQGREAKILPCYHTFCVPCLAELAMTEEESETSTIPGQDSDREGGRLATIVTCPTCRRVIPVPAGGVTAFQTNFYLDTSSEAKAAGPVLCHICDGEKKAQFQCHKCQNNICSQCRRSHDKLCQGGRVRALPPDPSSGGRWAQKAAEGQVRQQVEMVEDALKTLSGEESRLQQDRRAVEDSIQLRYAAVLRQASEARDACGASLREASRGLTQRLTSQMAEARHARDTLHQQLSPSQPDPVVSASQLRAALFLQGDLPIILSRSVDEGASLLTHQVEDDASVMTDALRSLMGRVVTSSQSSGPAHSQAASGSPGLQDHRGAVSSVGADPSALPDLYRKMEDLTGRVNCLQSSNSQLSQQVTLLSSSNSKLCSEQSALQREMSSVKELNTALQREMSSVKEQNTALQREVRALKDKNVIVHQDLAVLTAHKDNVGAQLTTLDSRVVTMQTQLSSQQTNLTTLKADHAAGLSQLTAVQSDVTTLQGDEASVKTEVGQLKTDCAELNSDLAKVQGTISDVDKLKADMAKVQGTISDVDKLKADMAKVQGTISDVDKLKADMAKVQGTISDVDKLKADMAKVQGTISDVDKLKADMAKVQGNISDVDKLKADMANVQGTISDVDKLKADMAKVQGTISDVDKLKADMAKVQGTISDVDKLKADMAKVQGTISDVDKLKADMAKVQGTISDVDKLKAELTTSSSQVTSLQQRVQSAQDSMQDTRKALTALEARFATANTQVAFRAELKKKVITSKKEILICDNINTNVGGGYDGHTGVFTTPLGGTYCFMANASPCSRDVEKTARLDIVVDSVLKGYVRSEGRSWSTGHTVLKMTAGQRVWLRTYDGREYTFNAGAWTFFTGMLLQADV